MEIRKDELLKLKAYTEDIDKDLTMILQSLQWDRKHILEHSSMVSCKFDSNHRVLADRVEEHEQECLLRHNGYTVEDKLLPDPLDTAADTLIKLTKQDIMNTIDNAAKLDPTFKRVCIDTLYGSRQVCPLYTGSGVLEPQTLGRLQCAYSADERRAIHDAVVSAAPSCHDLADLALPSAGENEQATKAKSRTEILAELRDMRRRRTKYRVAAKSKNYSDVLRDVIKSQMELYNEVLGEVETKPNVNELNAVTNKETRSEPIDDVHYIDTDRDRYDDRRDKRETDREREQSRSERSDKDNRNKSRRYGEDPSRDRRNKGDSSERRFNRRKYDDHRSRELSREVKLEVVDDNDHRDRSGYKRHRDRSKDERQDRGRKHKEEYAEGHSRDDGRRSGKYRHRSKEKNDSDEERARNLIREIKREIESVERSQGDEVVSAYKESVEVGRHRDHSRDNRRGRDENNHRHSKLDDSRSDRSRDRFDDRRSSDYKMHKERKDERENREKHKKSRVERHKESYKSEENEMRHSRTEEKHRRYYEIYSELDKRRNKESYDDNDK